MSFKEINNLRKQGNLSQAFEKASEFLDQEPNNIWAIRSMGWILVNTLKCKANSRNIKEFLQTLDSFIELEIPADEKLLIKNSGFWITKQLFQLVNKGELTYVDQLLERIKKIPFDKPSGFHSSILCAVMKISDCWEGFLDFIKWWNFDNLSEQDFAPFESSGGKRLISLAERAHLAYARRLEKEASSFPGIERIEDESLYKQIEEFIPRLENLCRDYPGLTYPPYYLSLLQMRMGKTREAMKSFLPFARKKGNEFWVWHTLYRLQPDEDLKIACLCKALLLNAPDKMKVKVREDLAGLLVSRASYPEATFEIQKIQEIREKEGWKLSERIKEWLNSTWFDPNLQTKEGQMKFYQDKSRAVGILLYEDIEPKCCIIEYVNERKKLAFFIITREIRGHFHYNQFNLTGIHPGQFLKLRFKKVNSCEDEYLHVLSAETTSEEDPSLVKEVKGRLSILPDQNIGFVEDVFLDSSFIMKNNILNYVNMEIGIRAIPSYDKKKKKWGWRAVKLIFP